MLIDVIRGSDLETEARNGKSRDPGRWGSRSYGCASRQKDFGQEKRDYRNFAQLKI